MSLLVTFFSKFVIIKITFLIKKRKKTCVNTTWSKPSVNQIWLVGHQPENNKRRACFGA
jgi:hypothetical protein